MFIAIPKIGQRYAFIVGDDPSDPPETFLDSYRDFKWIPGAQATYQTFAEAHSYGSFIADRFPNLPLGKKAAVIKTADLTPERAPLSPEDAAVSAAEEQPDFLSEMMSRIKRGPERDQLDSLDALAKNIKETSKGITTLLKEVEDENNKERLNKALKRLKIIEKSTKRMLSKIKTEESSILKDEFPFPAAPSEQLSPLASRKSSPSFAKDCLIAFGEAAAISLYASHPEAYLKCVVAEESREYQAIIAVPDHDICLLTFTEDLLLNGVFPCGPISRQAAYHSLKFFEQYFEPIINAVGHYLVQDTVLIPHHVRSSRRIMAGWNLPNQCPARIEIRLPSRFENRTWSFTKTAEAPLTANQWQNAQVRCLKQLPSYYHRTGIVKSVIPRPGYLDIAVDFGRGLGVVVMTNEDLQFISKLDDSTPSTIR